MIEELQDAFAANVAEGLESGASVCVWRGGKEECCLFAGDAQPGVSWQENTLVPIYSATKAAAAACLLLALYDCCQGPYVEVGDIWSAFPAPHCTIAEILSHQCGLAALAHQASIFDLQACRSAIESTLPSWQPPLHGYHPHTFGPILDILMLELCGQRIGEFWERRVRQPLGLDFYIGQMPECVYSRVAYLRAPRMRSRMPNTQFYAAFFDRGSPTYRAFHSITGLASAREMNTPEAWQCASPAKGGVASSRGLTMFYQALLGLVPASPFPVEVLEWMTTPQCKGMDRTLLQPTSFTCGLMCEPASFFGHGGYGHAGAGGSLGFCEPETGLSFAYVMNQMEIGVLPGPRVLRLLHALKSED